jgi:hypothetical protein
VIKIDDACRESLGLDWTLLPSSISLNLFEGTSRKTVLRKAGCRTGKALALRSSKRCISHLRPYLVGLNNY